MKTLIALALILFSTASHAIPTFKTNPEDFFYAQQTQLWVFSKVPKDIIRRQVGETLDQLGLEIASFEDPNVGYVIIKPMVFMAEFGFQTATIPGTSASTEIELTVLVHPKSRPPTTRGTFADYISGRMKNSPVGQYRLDVLCDHEVAVAAGRKNFGEHKFLGSFEYNYPTANTNVGSAKPFSLDMSAYTYQGAGQKDKLMFRIQVDLAGLRSTQVESPTELLFSSFPQEPTRFEPATTVGEHRHYNMQNMKVFLVENAGPAHLTIGDAHGATQLKPVAPFGDGKAIVGSEKWPEQMRDRVRGLLTVGEVAGYLLYQTPPAEYESKPFVIR